MFLHAGYSLVEAGGLLAVASLAAEHGLWGTRPSVAVWAHSLQLQGLSCPIGIWDLSSQTRNRTHIPCTVRWILNPWSSREVPEISFFFFNLLSQKGKEDSFRGFLSAYPTTKSLTLQAKESKWGLWQLQSLIALWGVGK